jgi:hypothetical protein
MDGKRDESAPGLEGPRPPGYEPPRVEQVVTTTELDREALYAGISV